MNLGSQARNLLFLGRQENAKISLSQKRPEAVFPEGRT